jgi:hypothetical protein
MQARWGAVAAIAAGCWTSTPPPRLAAPPPSVRVCKIIGHEGSSVADVSAVAGEEPYLAGFDVDRAMMEVGIGDGAEAWLPLALRWGTMTVRGFVRGRNVELYLRAPRMLAGAVLVGSGHQLTLTRGRGDHVDVDLGISPGVRVVDPRALPRSFACTDLAAFGAPYVDARDALGLHVGDDPQQFVSERVALALTPGGPDAVTLETRDRTAYVIDRRAGFTRVWVPLTEIADVAIVGWVPASSITPAGERDEDTGWGTIGTGRSVPLRRCAEKTAVSLVRAGRPGRIVVGELAAGSVVDAAPDPEVPADTLVLQRHTTAWLHLVDDARLVVDEAACAVQNRRPTSGP